MVNLMSWGHEKKPKNFATDLTPLELEGLVQALDANQQMLLKEIKSLFAVQTSGNVALFNDLFFVRFLRARNFDIKKTSVMLTKYFNWRNDVNVPLIIRTDMSQIRDTVREFFPHAYHGIDKLGRPIYIERMGLGDPGKLLKTLTTEQLTMYYVQRYEYMVHVMMPCASRKVERPIEQLLTIVDLNGFTISQINSKLKAFLSVMSQVTQDYYPELLGKLLFVNTPKIFSALWTLISTLVDKKTLGKISVISSKTQSREKLLELVNVDQLPEFLGGSCSDVTWQTSQPGPWNDENILNYVKNTNTHIDPALFNLKFL